MPLQHGPWMVPPPTALGLAEGHRSGRGRGRGAGVSAREQRPCFATARSHRAAPPATRLGTRGIVQGARRLQFSLLLVATAVASTQR